MLNSQCFVNTGLSKTLLKFIHVFLFTLLNVVISVGLCIIFILGSWSCGAPNGSSWPLAQCLVTKKMAAGHQPS